MSDDARRCAVRGGERHAVARSAALILTDLSREAWEHGDQRSESRDRRAEDWRRRGGRALPSFLISDL
jgi:hypothetical protein